MYLSDLQKKSIINIYNGKNLGKITDMYFNEEGNITEFTIQKRFKIFKIINKTILKISEIKTIGEDVILVDIKEE